MNAPTHEEPRQDRRAGSGLATRLGGALLFSALLFSSGATGQTPPAPAPGFFDPARRLERPDTSALRVIRFITDDEYPPFGFVGPDGALTGFNVELARAICEELKVVCTMQARRFDTILGALERGEADAAIASIAITAAARERVAFTRPYYRTPARFVGRLGAAPADAQPKTLAGRTVGVVDDTAHAAFLARYFPEAERRAYPTLAALLTALRAGETELAFGDGVTLAVWLNSADAGNCCAFFGGPYLEPTYFGDGVGIAARPDNPLLRRALDFALARIAQQGLYAEIYLKYFPVGFF